MDVFSPFLTLQGEATVRLQRRIWLHRSGEGDWEFRGNCRASTWGRAVASSDRWTLVQPR